MALVSYGFGFFCAVLLLLYYIVPGRFQWRILLAASVLFYGFAGPLWILILRLLRFLSGIWRVRSAP